MRNSQTSAYRRNSTAPTPATGTKPPSLARFERSISEQSLNELADMIAKIIVEETDDITAELQKQASTIKRLSDRLDDAEQALTAPTGIFAEPTLAESKLTETG